MSVFLSVSRTEFRYTTTCCATHIARNIAEMFLQGFMKGLQPCRNISQKDCRNVFMSTSFFVQQYFMKYLWKVSWKLVRNVSEILQKTFTNRLYNLQTCHEIFQKSCGIIFRNITVNLAEIFHRKIAEMFLCPHHFSFSNISWNICEKFLENL